MSDRDKSLQKILNDYASTNPTVAGEVHSQFYPCERCLMDSIRRFLNDKKNQAKGLSETD